MPLLSSLGTRSDKENTMRKTRVRRGSLPRRGRSTRTRRRAVVRRRSARRHARYRYRARTSRWSFGKSSIAAAVVVVLALALYLAIHGTARAATGPPAGTVARQFIYTVPTANDAIITLPNPVKNELLQIGLAHRSIALTRVNSTGKVFTSYIDMTPRTGNSSNDPVLKVTSRAIPVIDAKISAIEKSVNTPAATTGDGHALYVGLTRTDFTGTVTIISSGLDLANPDNFRALNWSVPPEKVVAEVKKSGALPALQGPVTFVTVPTAGPQPQLGQAQKNYRNNIWASLLTASGATSVTFIDADGITASPRAPSAPTVPVPSLPGTPIPQVHKTNKRVTCTVPASYFRFDTSRLIDDATTKQDLTPCINAALAAHATFALDGWASYEGPLNTYGRPEFDYPSNRKLSKERVLTIAKLLVDDFGVSSSAITRETGHGNVNQPDPDPRSPANRIVVITYTIR
jgi:hypothetical protein